MDRAVKIWRIPPSVFSPSDKPILAREDKPLFSTDLVHKARVFKIEWYVFNLPPVVPSCQMTNACH